MKKLSLKFTALLLTVILAFSCSIVAFATDTATDTSLDFELMENVQDGVILHAFCWSYDTIRENLPAIAQAGYSAIQTSPVQQPKDRGPWENVDDQYWKPYQPQTYSIATNSWFGTKEDLIELCDEAHKYGIKIICDVVLNHLGNNNNGEMGTLDANLINTLPDLYNDYMDFINNGTESKYFHMYGNSASDSKHESVVRGFVNNMVSLNTSSEYVQELAIGLLKECVDCGVDGFRFDAAKHIETPDDGEYASDYWPVVLGAASDYAAETQNGKELYYYGEILNGPGRDRSIDWYTEYMSVTDNTESDTVTDYVIANNALSTYRMLTKVLSDDGNDEPGYWLQAGSSKTVLWAESHDTYMGARNVPSNENIVKSWALHASRKNATSLYFARPEVIMGKVGDITWKSATVTEANKFHNAFVGQDEKPGVSGDLVYNQRGTTGMVIVNCNGTDVDVNIEGTTMTDGEYIDTVTGNNFTVVNGTVSGRIGSSGVAIVYNSTPSPRVTVSQETTSFKGETTDITITVENADTASYEIADNGAVEFPESVDITIGEGFDFGTRIPLKVTVTQDNKSVTFVYYYEKIKPANTGVFVYFDNSKTQYEQVYCYVADKYDNNDRLAVNNSNWPGEKMDYDPVSGLYYYEIPDKAGEIEVPDGDGTKLVPLKLLNSETSGLIFNDGKGLQYPAQASNKSFSLAENVNGAKSFIMKANGYKWETTEFTIGNPVGILGDSNSDEIINVSDATYIQKYLINTKKLVSVASKNADVNNDGAININDVTLIQKYCAGMTVNCDIGVER